MERETRVAVFESEKPAEIQLMKSKLKDAGVESFTNNNYMTFTTTPTASILKLFVNLADFACIMSRPSIEELNQVAEFKKSFGFTPNLVTDVYKNRRGRWNMVRIWSMHDLGTCRKYDLFITTANMKSVDNFIIIDFTAYEDETLKDLELLYNTGEISDTLNNQLYIEPNSENILDNLTNAFGDDKDRLERLKDRSISDLL